MKNKQGSSSIKNEIRRALTLRISFMRLSMAFTITVDSTTVSPYPPFVRATILISSVLLPALSMAMEVMN
jgi:hypothetical protein